MSKRAVTEQMTMQKNRSNYLLDNWNINDDPTKDIELPTKLVHPSGRLCSKSSCKPTSTSGTDNIGRSRTVKRQPTKRAQLYILVVGHARSGHPILTQNWIVQITAIPVATMTSKDTLPEKSTVSQSIIIYRSGHICSRQMPMPAALPVATKHNNSDVNTLDTVLSRENNEGTQTTVRQSNWIVNKLKCEDQSVNISKIPGWIIHPSGRPCRKQKLYTNSC